MPVLRTEEETQIAAQETLLPKHRNEMTARWQMLLFMCVALLGSYYCYDNPAAIQNPLMAHFIGHNQTLTRSEFNTNFGLLYSVYSFPNVILPFFGGYFSDKLGVARTTIVFACLITVGQLVFAIGLTLTDLNTSWYVMWIGRTIFGFGGESLSVSTSAMIAQWFTGKELAMAMGANLALARLGSVFNDELSLYIAQQYPIYMALWVGLLFCFVSVASTIMAYRLDKNAVLIIAHSRQLSTAGVRPGISTTKALEDTKLLESEIAEEGFVSDEINIRGVLSFRLAFWLLTVSCITVYGAILPFNNIASNFIVYKWLAPGANQGSSTDDGTLSPAVRSAETDANTIMLITYLVAGILTPFLGALIDRIGKRAWFCLGASVVVVGVHSILAYTMLYPVVPLVLLGLAYSFYAAALWPSIALVVDPKMVGTAYGVVTAVQNLGLAIVPLAVAALQPATGSPCPNSYNCVEELFIGLACCGIITGVWLNVDDYRSDIAILNLSDAQVSEIRKMREHSLSKSLLTEGEKSQYRDTIVLVDKQPQTITGSEELMDSLLSSPITPAHHDAETIDSIPVPVTKSE